MKKTLIALSLILSVSMAYAQPKTPADAQKGVDKALAATQDAKKATKAATWMALGKAYVAAYEQPTRNLLQGLPQTEVKLSIRDQRVLGSEPFKGSEAEYTKDIYADKELFYGPSGALDFWYVTKPAIEGDILALAQNAYLKAYELDPKAKGIAEAMEDIHAKIASEALAAYLMNNLPESADLFKKAAAATENPVLNKVDSMNIYYTALISGAAGKKAQAIEYYNKCIDLKFYQEGNVFSNLGDIYRQEGDTTAWKATLENGFASYPQSQGILVGLINLYRETNDDPNKMISLLRNAQENEPDNASLYYVEGDIYKQMGNNEEAIKSYEKSFQVNNNYVFGILGIGILYYDNAVKIQEKAGEELDDLKFNELMKEVDVNLEKAIEPFERAFGITKDKDIQVAIAEYLKNIYFRLREKNADYQAAYEKYNNMLKEN